MEIDQVATTVADLSASCETFAKVGAGEVTITWMNDEEKVFAESWPTNVRHSTGIDVLRGWEVIEDKNAVLGSQPAIADVQ